MEQVGVLPWDLSTFVGRLNYYARVTDPRLVFSTNSTLNKAKEIVTTYQDGSRLHLTNEEIIRAHVIYDSTFHPDNGTKMNIPGRMCAQAPCGMLVIGGLLTFYKTMPQLVAMQFAAQIFGANINYTNRNAKSQITKWQVATAFFGAAGGATLASLLLKSLLSVNNTNLVDPLPPKKWLFVLCAKVLFLSAWSKAQGPLLVYWMLKSIFPDAENIIIIEEVRTIWRNARRQWSQHPYHETEYSSTCRELIDGIVVTDKDGNALGKSKIAAAKGIGQVLLSRICLLGPVMLVVPALMEVLERRPFFKRGQFFLVCTQVLLSGAFMTITVPIACSLFPQRCSLRFDQLETSLQQEIRKNFNYQVDRVYFNKGL